MFDSTKEEKREPDYNEKVKKILKEYLKDEYENVLFKIELYYMLPVSHFAENYRFWEQQDMTEDQIAKQLLTYLRYLLEGTI